MLKPYQKDRLTAFLNPATDPADEGYQINQSLTAIGSGGKTGRGDEATQTKLDFLPEHHTDFMFSVVGEEFGFVGAALVLSLFALLIWRALRILTMSKNFYGALVAGGITAMLMFQVFVNVGMTIGIMPITGIPLPLCQLRRLVGNNDIDRHRPACSRSTRKRAKRLLAKAPMSSYEREIVLEKAVARLGGPWRNPGRHPGIGGLPLRR